MLSLIFVIISIPFYCFQLNEHSQVTYSQVIRDVTMHENFSLVYVLCYSYLIISVGLFLVDYCTMSFSYEVLSLWNRILWLVSWKQRPKPGKRYKSRICLVSYDELCFVYSYSTNKRSVSRLNFTHNKVYFVSGLAQLFKISRSCLL